MFIPLKKEDIADVIKIQQECYIHEYQESEPSILSKINTYPKGAFGIYEAIERGMLGYLIFFPWYRQIPVPLSTPSLYIPEDPNCIYIPDFALSRKARGKKLGERSMKLIVNLAKSMKINIISLISVQNSQDFWQKMGFLPIQEIDYGENNKGLYMEKIF